MAFNLAKLQTKLAPAPAAPTSPPDLAETLAASVEAAVAINRPASHRPNQGVTVSGSFGPAAEMAAAAREAALTVATIEAPAAAYAQLEFVVEEPAPATYGDARRREIEAACPTAAAGLYETGETPPAPKARRGRPRKAAAPAADASGVDPVSSSPGDADPKAPAATEPPASGCAPSAGDLAAAVSAVQQARAALSAALLSLGVES